MQNAKDREKLILKNLRIAKEEGRRAFKKYRFLRNENRDDFFSIATIILIRAIDWNFRKGYNNHGAWLRTQTRWGLSRYVGRTDDRVCIEIKDYMLEPLPWDYSGLIDIARRINKDKRSRNKAKCKSRAAKRAEMIEFYGPHFF